MQNSATLWSYNRQNYKKQLKFWTLCISCYKLQPRFRKYKGKTIADVLDVEPNIKQLPMQLGDVERTYADISKAKKMIGYNPKTSFKQGINNFVEWYKKNQY